MPIVNYVREHIRFMEYATDEHLTASERLLWYALMHVMNQRAQGKVWPDEFIRISNDRLLSYCPMKYDTIAAARNGLKQRGLIEYTKGEKNKISPAYRMIYFYPEYAAPDTESDADYPLSYPEIPDNIGGNKGGNTGGNSGGNSGGNKGGNTGDYSINYTKENQNKTELDDEDDQEEEGIARAREEATAAWIRFFGKAPTPAVQSGLAWRSAVLGFEDGVLTKAVEMAAMKASGSPFDYIITLLSDWKQQRIRSVRDVEEYTFLRDATQGKLQNSSYAEGAFERLRAFRQDRETEAEREAREARENQEAEHRAAVNRRRTEREAMAGE